MDDFAAATGIDWSGDVGMVRYGNDKNIVLFYRKPVPNAAKSKETGRPFYENKVFVRVHPPGERLNINDRPATEEDARRWPIQWAQFKQNKEQVSDGTPIDLLYPENPAIGSTLRANGVHTIEQCADLSGPAIDAIGMGAQHYSNDAKRYLEAAQKGVHQTQMRKELDERDGEIRVLKQQVDLLKAQLNQLMSAQQNSGGMEQLQQLLSQMMTRPQFPPAGVPPTQTYDAQAQQIAAVHPTRDIAEAAKRIRRKRQDV